MLDAVVGALIMVVATTSMLYSIEAVSYTHLTLPTIA